MDRRPIFGAWVPSEAGREFLADGVSLAEVISAYSDRARRTEEVVRSAPSIDLACLGCEGELPPAHVLLGLPEPLDLRWVVIHLVEETAHHAGHADATREMLDGSRMRA